MSLLGRLARLPLSLIDARRPRRILSGPLRGAVWLPHSASHSCWLGTYERSNQRLLGRSVTPGDVVFDIGANVGFFSLLAARLTGPTGRVVAFEPLPRNVGLLRRHVAINEAPNVSVVQAAVGERSGSANFAANNDPSMGSLAANGELIALVSIDDLVAAGEVPVPDVVKIDVEGAESRVLEGGSATFARHRPKMLLAAHGWLRWTECSRLLSALGYAVTTVRDGARDGNYSLFAAPRST